jgi:hypothetical protein
MEGVTTGKGLPYIRILGGKVARPCFSLQSLSHLQRLTRGATFVAGAMQARAPEFVRQCNICEPAKSAQRTLHHLRVLCRKVCIACKVRKARVLASHTMCATPTNLVSPGKAAGDTRLFLCVPLLLSSAGKPCILESTYAIKRLL